MWATVWDVASYICKFSDAFITSFKLYRDGIYGVCATKTVDYWLRFAIQSKEKELDLTVRHFFFVSSFVMQVHYLKFKGLKLDVTVLLASPTLKALFEARGHLSFSLSHFESSFFGFCGIWSWVTWKSYFWMPYYWGSAVTSLLMNIFLKI